MMAFRFGADRWSPITLCLDAFFNLRMHFIRLAKQDWYKVTLVTRGPHSLATSGEHQVQVNIVVGTAWTGSTANWRYGQRRAGRLNSLQ
jgi:hypothetical protein